MSRKREREVPRYFAGLLPPGDDMADDLMKMRAALERLCASEERIQRRLSADLRRQIRYALEEVDAEER